MIEIKTVAVLKRDR